MDAKKQEIELNGQGGIQCTLKTNFDDAASTATNAIVHSRACWIVDNLQNKNGKVHLEIKLATPQLIRGYAIRVVE